MKKVLSTAFLLALVAAAATAYAEDTTQYPILSAQRLTVGARLEHSWYSGNPDGPVSFLTNEVGKEFGVGGVAAYSLTGGQYPTSLVGGTVYALDSRFFRSWVGFNVRLFSGRGD